MKPVALLVLISSAASAENFWLSKDGYGPLAMTVTVNVKGGKAVANLSGRNDSGWPLSHVVFCVKGNKPGCAFRFWTTDTWEAGGEMEWAATTGPNQRGLNAPSLELVALQRLVPKLRSVYRVFIGEIGGTAGAVARDKLLALLANEQRFQVVETVEVADAIIAGHSDLLVGPTVSTTNGSRGAAVAVIGNTALGGGGGTSTTITSSSTALSLALHASLRSGETVWGWDDSNGCGAWPKTQCAVADLIGCAGDYKPGEQPKQ